MSTVLWKTLNDAKLISSKISDKTELESPWMIKILVGFSGWLATFFISGFFFALFTLLNISDPPFKVIGIILVVSAFFILHRNSNEFLENFALAISLTGQILLVIGLYQSRDADFNILSDLQLIWFSIAVISLILTFIMPNYIHRVFSTFATAIGFASVLYLSEGSFYTTSAYGAFLMLITALVWLNEFTLPKQIEKLQAIGYGLVIALIALKGTNLFIDADLFQTKNIDPLYGMGFQPFFSESLLSAVMVFIIWKILRRTHPKPLMKNTVMAIIGALLLSIFSDQAQGITVGVTVILLGFSASNRILIGLGILSLLFFISSYYYLLELTLLEKSIILLILGVELIIARWLMNYLSSKKNQEAKI